MQKRLVRKLELERFLSTIESHPAPKVGFEQYTIPADVAATVLYLAAYTHDDIVGKRVLDMGCGTGRLALGAAFLGAKEGVGVDIDVVAVKAAFENGARSGLGMRLQWVVGDVGVVNDGFDTVLQNPPFGVQRRGADRRFLETALQAGKRVYSLHSHVGKDDSLVGKLKARKGGFVPVSPSAFLENFIEERGGRVEAVYAMLMTVPHMFTFHTRRKHEFVVDLYVIERS
jgi:putative methylase